MTTNDKYLFTQIAEGDENAFEELFHAYVPVVHNAIIKITKSEPVTKDIIQDVFLYLWMDRENLVNIENPQNWIFKIAYNRSYSWLAKKSTKFEEQYSEYYEQIKDNQLEESLALNETNKLINEAIELLPAQEKKIFQHCLIQSNRHRY